MRKLLDGLEDNDDVQAVWHNWENEADYEGWVPPETEKRKTAAWLRLSFLLFACFLSPICVHPVL